MSRTTTDYWNDMQPDAPQPDAPKPDSERRDNESTNGEDPVLRDESLAGHEELENDGADVTIQKDPSAEPGEGETVMKISAEDQAALNERVATMAAREFPLRLTVEREQLRENILWRRLTRIRTMADLPTHPVYAPPVIGIAIGCLTFSDELMAAITPAAFGWLGPLVVIIGLFTVFEAVHHYFSAQKLRALNESQVLAQMRMAGVTAHDILAGAVLPYSMGQRLGIFALILPWVITSDSIGYQVFMGALLLLGMWGVISSPSEDIPTMRLYLKASSFGGAARVALAVIFGMVLFYAGMIALIIGIALLLLYFEFSTDWNTISLVSFIIVFFVYSKIATWILKKRTISFYKKHGGLTRFLDTYLEQYS